MIYPPRCPICHDIVDPDCEMICQDCVKRLPLVVRPRCAKCGKPVAEGEELCSDCQEMVHEYTQGVAVFVYEEIMRKSISYFKYMGRREYGRFYAAAAWKFEKETLKRWNPQVIVPVPVHISRKVQRGYNQAEIIARSLGERVGLPVAADAVIRKAKTKAQKDLSPEERRKNLEKAFTKGKNPFPWKRVLLVDDIYTTGSTADAVSRVLKECGAQEIYLLSVCIGKGFVV